ncbi:hypothetical protein ACFL4Z_00915 [candidate division KSB1 bacterium]
MDKFVKTVLITTISSLILIFVLTFIGVNYFGNEFNAVDDSIESMITELSSKDLSPSCLFELPMDAEVGAFTITAFGFGVIFGYLWRKIVEKKSSKKAG